MKTLEFGVPPRVSISTVLGQSGEIFISNKVPIDADDAIPVTIL